MVSAGRIASYLWCYLARELATYGVGWSYCELLLVLPGNAASYLWCRLVVFVSVDSNSISGIRFFCKQSLLPQDDTSDVFLRMAKLVFDYAINVTAVVLLSGHYVKLERLQH
nr:Biomphalaria glabrata cytochrome b5 reductase 4-like; transcript variant X4 [Biomphalaria glabrata]